MKRRAAGLAFLGAALFASACGGTSDEITITFPDQASRSATAVLAVTAFEPLLTPPDTNVPQLVKCSDIGVFPPTRILDPDTINTFPNLGSLLSDHRKSQTYPLDGDWTLDIPNVKEDSGTNPWGAVLVYIEARGEVRATPAQGGGQITATLLAGCYCIRTRTGSHPNRVLDQAVKAACTPIADDSSKQRVVPLQPVISPVFKLEPASVQALTAPRNQLVSPGPEVRVTTRRCSDTGGASDTCFRCTQPCNELNNLSNVPILYTVDQPGGSASPKTQIVLTDKFGGASGLITADSCTTDIKVTASVVGRADTSVDFTVTCVDPVSSFKCDESLLPAGREPRAMTRLPGANGDPDFVAILYDTGSNASLEVRNPLRPNATRTLEFPGETARAVHGFYYQTGSRPEDRGRPALVVVTSGMVASGEQLRLYVYEWVGGELVPQDGSTGNGAPMAGDCPTWVCETEMPLCGTVPCGCHLMVEFQTEVNLATKDVDGDGLADLALGTSNDLPITTYYSSQASAGHLFETNGCACGKYAQAPTTFALLDFGGPGESAGMMTPDLVIGAPGGAFVRYGTRSGDDAVIPCGQPARFGGLVPVRDLASGYFRCDRAKDPTGCEGFQDLVEVAAKQLGGGSFDDPGTIRVIYGAARDLSMADDLFDEAGTNVDLVPRPLAGEEDPRDPRSAEVGDINADGFDDVAVLFRSSEELHVWLGSADRGLGEVASGVNFKKCEGGSPPDSHCTPLEHFALADFDADGRLEVAVVCNPSANALLRRYDPQVAP